MNREERLHTAVLVAPASERRKTRKQRRAAAARIAAEQREADRETARQEARQQRAEQKATITLPTAGQPGPAGPCANTSRAGRFQPEMPT